MEPISLAIKTKPIRITIVDLMGVFVPGVVWLIFLVAASLLLVRGYSPVVPSPLGVILYFVGLGNTEPPGAKIYFATIVGSFVIGFAMKPVVTRIARIITGTGKSHLRPKAAVETLSALLLRRAGIDLDEIEGGRQPFSGSKRLLRLHVPVLWEDAEHLEAEVRMLASLFVLSAMSTVVSLVVIFFSSYPIDIGLSWIIPSLIGFALLFWSFRRINDSEIRYVYTDALLARALLDDAVTRMRVDTEKDETV